MDEGVIVYRNALSSRLAGSLHLIVVQLWISCGNAGHSRFWGGFNLLSSDSFHRKDRWLGIYFRKYFHLARWVDRA